MRLEQGRGKMSDLCQISETGSFTSTVLLQVAVTGNRGAQQEFCLSKMFQKNVLSTMGVSKESISKFLIGNRFHVK